VVQKLIELEGFKDPLVRLSEIVSTCPDPAIAATASSMLAPYLHAKLASKPTPPDPVYIQEAISLPRPTNVRQALENINSLSEMKSLGQLDIATADSLISDNRIVLDALIDEAKLITAQGGSPEQTIYIEGGLPPLPGTNITMPPTRMNGANAIEQEQAPPPGEASPDQSSSPGSTEP
jgi:hypothetical protein